MAKDAATVAADWAAKLGASTQKITDGVNAVTTAPGAAAARQKDVWASQVAAAKDKWAANTAKVTLQDWQTSMTTKGVQRIAAGATAAQPKMQAFLTKFLPFVESAAQSLPPRGNLEQNIARMTAMVRKTASFKN